MINLIRRIIFSVSWLLMLFSLPVLCANDKVFFWSIESNKAKVYLFGSIHLANQAIYPLRPEITQAFASADTLVVEANPEAIKQSELIRLVKQYGHYPGQETLQDHISPKTYQALADYAKNLGVPILTLKKMRPGFVMLNLTTAQLMKLGYMPDKGLDLHFIRQATNKKKIVELESLAEQLAIFSDLPEPDLFIKVTLESLTNANSQFVQMIDAWKRGDDEVLFNFMYNDQINKYPQFKPVMDKLLLKRNIKMAKSIEDMLNKKGIFFVVVGAAHYIGEDGIIELLKQTGYSAKRL
ncbi:TraB/GumN family protein [Spartinivicinus poritis]|uniref:TraB/GumN family protein n=1 Tax=Spartinivicinus poritis TaxID=2994640 RepID=A0ABT5U692_9GAMM|nr:TraB/GumN family protein [Spartinivicinus sp. A2-2]MDE1461884.1 TraB/GumN family protein [Spartinivicinus sp. A2-2]